MFKCMINKSHLLCIFANPSQKHAADFYLHDDLDILLLLVYSERST